MGASIPPAVDCDQTHQPSKKMHGGKESVNNSAKTLTSGVGLKIETLGKENVKREGGKGRSWNSDTLYSQTFYSRRKNQEETSKGDPVTAFLEGGNGTVQMMPCGGVLGGSQDKRKGKKIGKQIAYRINELHGSKE